MELILIHKFPNLLVVFSYRKFDPKPVRLTIIWFTPTIFFKIRQRLSKNQTSNLAEETPPGIDV